MSDHRVTDICFSRCLPLSWVGCETAHVSCMHVTHPRMTFWKKMNSHCILLESSEHPGLVTSSMG